MMYSYRCWFETAFVSPGTHFVAHFSLLVNSRSSFLSLPSAGIEWVVCRYESLNEVFGKIIAELTDNSLD